MNYTYTIKLPSLLELWPPSPATSGHLRPSLAAAGDRRPSSAILPFPFHSFLSFFLSFSSIFFPFLSLFISFSSLISLPLSLSLSSSLLIADADLHPASRRFLNANLRVLDICITRSARSCIDATRSPCPRLCPSRVNTTRNSCPRLCSSCVNAMRNPRPRPHSPRVLT